MNTVQESNCRRQPTVETALEWWKRCNRNQVVVEDAPSHDPSSAAWSFVRGNSGIAPIDAAWKRNNNCLTLGSSPDVISIDGKVGKTWMLISLAARFVVDTRASKYPSLSTSQFESQVDRLPFVVILDSMYDVTPAKVREVVHSTLLRQPALDGDEVENELKCCLDRIHVASVTDDILEWVPVLEELRLELKYNQRCANNEHPTLVLWDGFLTEPASNEHGKMEVVRQLARLIQECSVALVTSGGASAKSHNWRSQHKTHHLHLKRYNGKDCLAEITGMRAPFHFSLSSGGILS